MAKPGPKSPIDDPNLAKLVADAFADGLNRQAMCDMFGVEDRDTITKWRRDPRVQIHLHKIIEDRILQITRKVDGEMANRLEHANEMTVKELIEVRKEYLGGALRAQTEKADQETINQAAELLETPGMMGALEKILSGEIPVPGTSGD